MSIIEQFLANPNLIGFYVGFFAMLVLPITSFFVARDLFQNKFQMNPDKVNLYSAIVSVVTIYLLLIVYIFYYYYDDFKQVFCKKKNIQISSKDNNNLIKEKSG